MLHSVIIDKTDTCLTYVLKRKGLSTNCCKYESIDKIFNRLEFKENTLKAGDILLWDFNTEYIDIVIEITKDGILKKHPVSKRIHFAIYEGDGKISHVVRNTMIRPLPELMIDDLKRESKRMPDSILRLKIWEEF